MKYILLSIVLILCGCTTVSKVILPKDMREAVERIEELKEKADAVPTPDLGSSEPITMALGWLVYLGVVLIAAGAVVLVVGIPSRSLGFNAIAVGVCTIVATSVYQEYFYELIVASLAFVSFQIGIMLGRRGPQEGFGIFRKKVK